MKHLRLFPNAQVRNSVLADIDYKILSKTDGEPGVGIYKGTRVDPKTIPFYIDVRSTVTLAATSGLQMSTDGETWTDTVAGDLPTGKTYFRVASDQSAPLQPNWTEKSNSDYDIGGNINSLVKILFENDTTCYSFFNDTTWEGFFQGKSKLKSASNLILPATTLAGQCYQQMFYGCTSLVTTPALSAMTLAESCYSSMFNGCTSLTTTPALPATTLASDCYNGMFLRCTSLTTAPALPAMTLADSCYQFMLRDCSSLATAPSLPATTLAPDCYYGMFAGCTSLTTAPALPATTLAQYCYQNMFYGCTALTTVPELPATTLSEGCYNGMFAGCTSLNYIKCLATDISAPGCTDSWVNGVVSTGTFVKNPSMTSWTTGDSGIPSGWTVEDA